MIAAILFFVFFLVIYLTRPNRKRKAWRNKPVSKPNPKPTIEQARQQAMANFWLQALAQSVTKHWEEPLNTEIPVVIETAPTSQLPKPAITSETGLSDKIIQPLQAAAQAEITPANDSTAIPQTPEQVETYSAFVDYLKAFAAKSVTITTHPIKPEPVMLESGIIDISPEVQPIDYEEETNENLVKYQSGIPHWDHHYVYQASEINYASPTQQAFYRNFKKAFLSGNYINLEGNTNYAFILYFDLIQDYRQHKDLQKLEKQFKELEQICDRISGYSGNFIFNELKQSGQLAALGQLEGAWSILRNDRPSYLNWDWHSLYEHKMKLSKEEVKLLEPIYLSSGAFMNIDFICRQVIRLYIELVKALKTAYSQSGTNSEKEFAVILDIVARKQNRYHLDSPNYQYVMSHDSQIYSYILRYAESMLRSYYGYNRKLSVEGYLEHSEVKAIMQEKIIRHLEPRLAELYALLQPLDEVNEIELNAINPARWRNYIDPAIQSYLADKNPEQLEKLVRLNQKNPSRDLLLFELCRLLIPSSKSEAMAYYFRHVEQSKQDKKVWKLPTAAMQKQLFKNAQEALPFHTFLLDYVKEPDLEKGLEFARDYYKPIRKKINLDSQAIRQAEVLDSRTTELLSAYLNDEEEKKEPIIHQEDAITQTLQEMEAPTITAVPLIETQVRLSNPALTLLKAFQSHNFELSITEADTICKANGMMAAPLINSINEACFDLLDENLIENDEINYSIQTNYYYQIVNA
jgi:TerB-C domain